MKYYIYVSQTKVDMLFSQIPQGIRDRIATELKFDLKIFSVTLKEDATKNTLYSKLKVVVEYIETILRPGTIDTPKDYFKGLLPMNWAPIDKDSNKIVYFASNTARTSLILCGSLHHVLGYHSSPVVFSGSLPLHFMEVLNKILRSTVDKNEDDPERLLSQLLSIPNELHLREFEQRWALSDITTLASKIGPTGLVKQPVEFLARRLLEGQDGDRHVLLGSPLYVALAD